MLGFLKNNSIGHSSNAKFNCAPEERNSPQAIRKKYGRVRKPRQIVTFAQTQSKAESKNKRVAGAI
jgi:hypothetical protein